MYYKVTVLVEEDSLKDHLDVQNVDKDTIDYMLGEELQNAAKESIHGILSNYFTDYEVLDKNSVVSEDISVYNPGPSEWKYVIQ